MKKSKSKMKLVKGDITKIKADAIVNAANSSLLGGSGVDGAIHNAGGKVILNECMKIVKEFGECKTGKSVITSAGNLPAKYVIHTVGPVWKDGNRGEKKKLSDCYNNSLKFAVENGCRTVAFPNISTGVYGFPKKDAAVIAVDSVKNFLQNTNEIEEVIFVCFDEENFIFINEQLDII